MSENITIIEKELTEEEKLSALLSNSNDYFLVVMGIIIIFMQAGFGFLEAGSIRAKNTTNILIKNYADLCMGGISFWILGYSFAFGTHNPFIGLDYFILTNVPKSDYSFFFFQVSTRAHKNVKKEKKIMVVYTPFFTNTK